MSVVRSDREGPTPAGARDDDPGERSSDAHPPHEEDRAHPPDDVAEGRGGAGERVDPGRRDVGRAEPHWLVEVPLVGLALAAVAAAVYRVWERDWSVPFTLGGDALAHVALIDVVGWTGTPGVSTDLGAPHGVVWSDMPVGADRLHLVLLRGLRELSGGPVGAFNAYLLVGLVLSGLAAFVVARRLGLSAPAAGLAALAFAVTPAQFARASVGHLFLSAAFSVPIGVLLAVWASHWSPPGALPASTAPTQGAAPPAGGVDTSVAARRPWWRRRHTWLVVGGVLLVGSAGVYYAAFTVVVTVGVGALVAARRGSWRDLVRPVAVAAGIGAVVVANVAGEALARVGDAGARAVLDSDSFGLRLAQMVLPVRDHRVGALADWSDRAFRIAAPGDRGAAIGLLAVVGLGVLAWWCVRHVGRSTAGLAGLSSGLLQRFGATVAVTVAVAATGAGGLVLATLGLTQVRAWSRMAIVVAFVGVVVAGALLDAVVRRRAWAGPVVAAAAVAVAGVVLVDQVGTAATSDPAAVRAEWGAAASAAASLEATLPAGSSVFQLPVGAFPAEVPLGDIGANDLLAPPLAGDGDLAWSTGTLAGREGDWQHSVAVRPVGEMVDLLAVAGFDALLVDRRGVEDPDALAEDLLAAVGRPEWTDDTGTYAWYDLRPVRAQMVERWGDPEVRRLGRAVTRPVGVAVEGSPGIRSTRDPLARHVGTRGAIVLTDLGADPHRPLEVSFDLSGEPGATVVLRHGDEERPVELGEDPVPVDWTVRPGPDGVARIDLRTDAAPLPARVSNWGDLRLEVAEIAVTDPAVGMLTN